MLTDPPATENPTEKNQWFTATHWSVVLLAGEGSSPRAAEALEELCRTYWYPLYAHVRRQGHGPHDAQDLMQEFFASLLARNSLQSVGREKGKFRSFLLAAMNHFLAAERDRANAVKRGGGKRLISLDEEEAEGRYRADLSAPLSPDVVFEKRWATTLLEQAFDKLRQEFAASGRAERFERLKIFLEAGTEPGITQQWEWNWEWLPIRLLQRCIGCASGTGSWCAPKSRIPWPTLRKSMRRCDTCWRWLPNEKRPRRARLLVIKPPIFLSNTVPRLPTL